MIAAILCWFLITLVFFSFGDIFVSLYSKVLKRDEDYSFFETFLIGLCITGTIICITSIWLPSGIKIAATLGVISILYLIAVRRKDIVTKVRTVIKSLSPLQVILIGSAGLLFMLFFLVPPQFPDIYYYHLQNILWNEEYHVVPGLANLEERFGFNSNLFLLCSAFGLRPLTGEFVFGINALCMVFMMAYIIRQAGRQRLFLIVLFIVVFVPFFMEYKTHIGCSSADLLPNLLIVYLLFTLLAGQQNLKKKSILFWLVPIFCITLKVSTVFICLVSLYLLILFIKEKNYKAVAFICISALIVVAPWLVRNVIISGYLIHPYPSVDLFTFDWKLPVEYSIESKRYIESFAISYDAMYNSSDYILDMPLAVKVQKWLGERHPLDICIAGAGLVSPLLMLGALLRKKVLIKEYSVLLLVWVIGLMGFIFWLVMAPAVRFGYGFIAIVFSIPVYLLFKDFRNPVRSLPANVFLVATIAYFGVLSVRYFLVVKEPYVSYAEIFYKPQSIQTRLDKYPVTMEIFKLNNTEFFKPLDGGCYDHVIPCSNNYIKNLEMRGKTLQEGFREKEN
ncbi:LIC_10190 family membrane protein [Dysgonomonas termitidis]|uniref:LIC_10190 family membrane protein n=1 Tax=Dysgonomonas termitidis TaxID=1516126 RepID=A0ABV9KVE4_9BACT